MKTQTQGPGECWLTCVCMLTDYPLEKIRREIFERFGVSWSDMVRNRRRAGYLGLRDKIAQFVVERTGAAQAVMDANWLYGTTIKRGRAPKRRVPKGRGIITLIKYKATNYYTGRRYIRAHAVAFENGQVYDPGGWIFTSDDSFDLAYRGWRIEKVIQVPRRRRTQ